MSHEVPPRPAATPKELLRVKVAGLLHGELDSVAYKDVTLYQDDGLLWVEDDYNDRVGGIWSGADGVEDVASWVEMKQQLIGKR